MMLASYFARPDHALAGDGMFVFLVGLGTVLWASATTQDVALDVARTVVRLGAGAMLLATFVAGVALGRSASRFLR